VGRTGVMQQAGTGIPGGGAARSVTYAITTCQDTCSSTNPQKSRTSRNRAAAESILSSEALGTGSLNAEVCAGTNVGRGCLNWVGAVIQGINAPRMQSGSGGNTGWNPQWTFDRCMGRNPPPYFPVAAQSAKYVFSGFPLRWSPY
jgi:hypothetical protein